MITTDNAVKSMIEQHIALNRVEATSRDLTRLYAVSSTIGAIADLRADSVAQVPMRVKNPNGEVVTDHPLCRIFKGGSSFTDLMRRTELSMYFWGRNFLHKQRNVFQTVTGLRWVNPNLYSLDSLSREGLRGFRIHLSPQYQAEPVTYIRIADAVYMHGVDFDDDVDGVAPAERAFLEASIEPERAQTALATFRNLAIPAAIIQPAAEDSQRTISPDEERTFIDRLRRLAQGALNAGRVIIAKRRYEYVQMQTPLKDMAMSDIAQEARLSVCIASRVPLELVQPSAANYAQFEGARRTWAHVWLVPACKWYASLFTEQLAAEHGDGWTVEPDFDAVPFLKEDTATRVQVINAKVTGGLLTLYDAQKEAGQEPDEALRGLYMIPGVGPVPAGEVANLWKTRQLPPTFDPGLGVTNGSINAMWGRSSPTAVSRKAADPVAYVSLMLADDAQIMTVQDALRTALGDADGIRWTPPDELHITLIYAYSVSDDQLSAIARAVKAQPVEVKTSALGVFEHDGERALYLQVTPTETLLELQRTLYTAFKAHGLALSQFSEPAAYKPHITLGYLSAEVDAPVLPVDVITRAEQVLFQRDDYRTFSVVPLKARGFIPDTQFREIKNWEAIALRRGASHPFELRSLANEPASAYLGAALPLLAGDPDGIRAAFEHARELLALKKKRDLSGLIAATPEEYAAYWGSYDDLMRQLGDDWLTEYMRRGAQAVGQFDRNVTADEIMRRVEAGRDDLIEAWIGTEDTPGTLTQLMFAGMAAGNEALIRNIPPKPRGAKAVLAIDWTLESAEARAFVQQYAFNLIRRLDATTRAQVQAALDAWLGSDDSLEVLHATLTRIFNDEARAQLIAQTESTRAYAEGSRQRWSNVGVKQVRFQTVRDAHVCPICAPLHNTVASIETGWKNFKGEYTFPPLHPGCRCFGRPVIDEELVNELEGA